MRNVVNRILNLLLFVACAGLVGTGLLLKFRLPPGSRGGHGLSALGYIRHEWGDLHFWLAVAFFVLALLHVVLHWPWVKRVAAVRHPILTPLALLAGLALGLVPILLPVRREDETDRGSGVGKHSEELYEAEAHPRGGGGRGKGQGGEGWGRGLRSGRGGAP